MEAPEKIYLCPSELAGIDYDEEWLESPLDDSIEYTRTDVIIDNAVKWLNRNTGFFNEKDFREAMKGE
jgi:hypothetical protein